MTMLAKAQLDGQLASILKHVQFLQHLNLALEEGRQEALAESRRLLGEIAWYRHQLEATVQPGSTRLRCAA